MTVESRGAVIHGVECYESWRADEDCVHDPYIDGAGMPLWGLCGHCQVHVDSTDPNHRVTPILSGGRGVECVLRGDITAAEGGPLR